MSLQPIHLKAGEGERISPIGADKSFYKAVGAQTGGNFALLEQHVEPGAGPRRHVHRREEESFYILEGEFTFEVGDQTIVAGPGSFVLGPRDIPHRFWNSGDKTGSFLLIVSPAGFEVFLREYGEWLAREPRDEEELKRLTAKYELELL